MNTIYNMQITDKQITFEPFKINMKHKLSHHCPERFMLVIDV